MLLQFCAVEGTSLFPRLFTQLNVGSCTNFEAIKRIRKSSKTIRFGRSVSSPAAFDVGGDAVPIRREWKQKRHTVPSCWPIYATNLHGHHQHKIWRSESFYLETTNNTKRNCCVDFTHICLKIVFNSAAGDSCSFWSSLFFLVAECALQCTFTAIVCLSYWARFECWQKMTFGFVCVRMVFLAYRTKTLSSFARESKNRSTCDESQPAKKLTWL